MKKCYHCHLKIITEKFTTEFENKKYLMCCPGCLAVFKFIMISGLGHYYKNRDAPGNKIDHLFKIKNLFDEKKIKNKFIKIKKTDAKIILSIEGVSCAACTWLIENHLIKIPYIKKCTVSLTSSKANIIWDISKMSLNSLINEFNKIGYKAYPYNIKKQEAMHKDEYRNGLKYLIISGLGMMQSMMLSFALYIGEFYEISFSYWCFIRWVLFIISTPVLFISGKNIFYNAYRSLKNKNLGMDFTISLSLFLAYLASIKNLIYNVGEIYFDSICMFIFFLLIARFLEMRTRHHAMEIISSLQSLNTDIVRILKNNIEIYTPITDIKINDIILVKPGEIIPLDGKIITGNTSIDESMLTGEFKPISKFKGYKVIGGTINIDNNIIIKVQKIFSQSRLTFIIKILEDINAKKPLDNFIINIIAKYFVISVLIITLIVTCLWIKIGHANIVNIILSMLVITCPCALSLSMPVALVTSINKLSKQGIIITKENIFEKINKITDVIFDKTGTLTVNKYYIKKFKIYRNISIKKIYSISYGMEKYSKHPISKAFYNIEIKNIYKINKNILIKNHINKGLVGITFNNIYNLGILNLSKKVSKKIKIKNKKNHDFYIFLSDKNGLIVSFKLINPLRKNAFICVKKIISLNINTHLLSGDSSNKVRQIKSKLNIKYYKKNTSIEDKVKYIDKLQKNKKIVMMVGDGINDSPALSKASISVALGSGSDLAKISSDIILLNNNLLNIFFIIKQSVKTKKIILQNISWAILYNFTGLLLASLDLITPYYAAIGMSLSSLIVVFNSLRLGKKDDI